MSKDLQNALDTLEEEKGISQEIVLEAIEAALVSAYKRTYNQAQNVEVVFNKGNIIVYSVKEVVEEVEDTTLEISLSDAHEINQAYELGDTIKFEVTPRDFGRIAAQTAKQVIMQRVREAERDMIYNEYSQYEDDLMQGIVERQDHRFIYVNLGKVEAVMSKQEQIPDETFEAYDRIKVYVNKVENTTKGPQVFVSRSHPNLIKRLFEQEVPEIYDGIVEIVSIAREAGDRSKVAVRSHDANVDPVGTCVGPRGQRVQSIVAELKGENMDIVEWSEDPATYIANALNPAQVVEVIFNKESNSCLVVVPDYQLSLAIGKKGQNVRLAAKLTGYKIDIKSETDMAKEVPAADETFDKTDLAYVETMAETTYDERTPDEPTLGDDFEEELQETEEALEVDERYLQVGELSSAEAEDQMADAEERDLNSQEDNE